jgi:hypothetical protein
MSKKMLYQEFSNLPEDLKYHYFSKLSFEDFLYFSDDNMYNKKYGKYVKYMNSAINDITIDIVNIITLYCPDIELKLKFRTTIDDLDQPIKSFVDRKLKDRKIVYLDLSDTSTKDASRFGNIRELNLSKTLVDDVSCLGNVHTLNFSDAQNIHDVSMLGNVHNLNLSYNNNFLDLSCLTNNKVLNLYESNTNAPDNLELIPYIVSWDGSICRYGQCESV